MEEKVGTGGPAFPADRLYNNEWQDGMTLRDYFAANALQELVGMCTTGIAAQRAYEFADAMLKARK